MPYFRLFVVSLPVKLPVELCTSVFIKLFVMGPVLASVKSYADLFLLKGNALHDIF
jgi:hypothetical protein